MAKKIFILASIFFLMFSGISYAGSIYTPTGFIYPVGTDDIEVSSSCGRWLERPAESGGCYPTAGVYHIGLDMKGSRGNSVRAIADGIVLRPSAGGWGDGNIGMLIKHRSNERGEFIALYAHIRSYDAKKEGDEVRAGETIGKLGAYPEGGDHLHFGILHPGLKSSVFLVGLGRWSIDKYGVKELGYYDNGFIDPIHFITHNGPDNWLSREEGDSCKFLFPYQPWFFEVCIADSGSCDDSVVKEYEECVKNPDASCTEVKSGVWSAIGEGGRTSGGTYGVGGDSYEPPAYAKKNFNLDLDFDIMDSQDNNHELYAGQDTLASGMEVVLRAKVEAKGGDAHDFIEKGKDTIEVDSFARIGIGGEWFRVCRNYIKVGSLQEEESETTIFRYVIPLLASGEKISFKCIADAEEEVWEVKESDNTSRIETFTINNNLDVNFISHNLSLTNGRTFLTVGDRYGLQVFIKDIGTDPSPGRIRSSYEIFLGGEWRFLADDESEASELIPGRDQLEYISDEGSVIAPSVPGFYPVRACANYQVSVPETNIFDNCTTSVIEVRAAPVIRSITITDPSSGEKWKTSSNHTIDWISQNITGNVKIEYSIDGGSKWYVIDSSVSNNGSKGWKMGDKPFKDIIKSDTNNARIRITSLTYPSVTATIAFSIDHK